MSRIALITGASRGIGRELAFLFARDGIGVVLVARSENDMRAVSLAIRQTCTVPVHMIPLDLSVPGSQTVIADYCREHQLHISYLVNNAGFGDYGAFAVADWRRQQDMINVNIMVLTALTREFLPRMLEGGHGRILQLASAAAFVPGPLMSVYFASKAYVLSFSEALSAELLHTGVTVTALCPGPTASGFQEAASLGRSVLYNRHPIPSSSTVARYGYRAMMNGKPVAIHGWTNKLMVLAVRLVPRSVVRNMSLMLQKGGH